MSALSYPSENLTLLLRLNQIPKLGASYIQQFLQNQTLANLKYWDREKFRSIGWTHKQIERWFSPELRYIEPALEWLSQGKGNVITSLCPNYPFLLHQINNPPPLLFVQGNALCLNTPQLAIVGSRYCSKHGEYWAKYFASELNIQGLTITSGLALGIDGFAHQAVVDQQGQTIAILGNGLERIYPARHKCLASQILENNGALVSEFLPNTPPVAENFPRRNRIISGLSLGTLVIEANIKSGSLITAHFALEQNREVFALPGRIQDSFSQGCHQLIKQGALLVENTTDILESLNSYEFPHSLHNCSAIIPANHKTSSIKLSTPSQIVTPIHPKLFEQLTHLPISADELANQLSLPIEIVLTQLLELELQGLSLNVEGGYIRQ